MVNFAAVDVLCRLFLTSSNYQVNINNYNQNLARVVIQSKLGVFEIYLTRNVADSLSFQVAFQKVVLKLNLYEMSKELTYSILLNFLI